MCPRLESIRRLPDLWTTARVHCRHGVKYQLSAPALGASVNGSNFCPAALECLAQLRYTALMRFMTRVTSWVMVR